MFYILLLFFVLAILMFERRCDKLEDALNDLREVLDSRTNHLDEKIDTTGEVTLSLTHRVLGFPQGAYPLCDGQLEVDKEHGGLKKTSNVK